jgi:hypothetical protein
VLLTTDQLRFIQQQAGMLQVSSVHGRVLVGDINLAVINIQNSVWCLGSNKHAKWER